jgi:hypothetical protein
MGIICICVCVCVCVCGMYLNLQIDQGLQIYDSIFGQFYYYSIFVRGVEFLCKISQIVSGWVGGWVGGRVGGYACM